MRLHRLEITAFGPFATSVTVDFDALSDAGVFLLCGDTGAGKSTVLDAVCFAFYGDVPGERSAAKQLRSHHAADGAVPRVLLEATVAGRRLRLTRSPSWQRPKRRGSGLTTEPAHVLVEELVDGAWCSRTNRLDEAGHLVGHLLGMSLSQFSQVVLLPQGQFDTFLRATSQERHTVLTQLFRTRRFEEVEGWLAERRTTLRRAVQRHQDLVTALLHRVAEATGAELPGGWADPDPSLLADDGRIAGWAQQLGLASSRELEAARTGLERVADRLDTATRALDAGRVSADLRARHARAIEATAQLAATADAAAVDQRRLALGRRAAVVRPLARAAQDAAAAADRAQAAAEVALLAVAHALADAWDDADLTGLAARARDATERAAVARSFLPSAHELTVVSALRDDLAARIVGLDLDRGSLAERLERLRADLAVLTSTVDAHGSACVQATESRQHLAALEARAEAQVVVAGLEQEVVAATGSLQDQRDVTIELREQLLELREARLHGMAAELASAMVVGDDCPVCGSPDHPAPATPAPGAPTRADEHHLRARLDDAEIGQEARADQLRGLDTRLAVARREAGPGTVAQLEAELTGARAMAAQAEQAVRELESAERRLDRARHDERNASATLAVLDADLRVAREQHATAERAAGALSERLAELLDAAPADRPDLLGLIRHHEECATALTTAHEARVEAARRLESAAEATTAATESAVHQGFADLDSALAAHLDEPALADLELSVAGRLAAEAEAAAVLEDPEVRAAADAVVPDLDRLEQEERDLAQTHLEAAATARLALTRTTRLAELTEELDSALTAWAVPRSDYAVVRSLAELVEGKGPDNALQMRLSAYVLAARLSQVVCAANERLARMSDDRYLLEHTAQRGVGERRGGLSLLVRDQWTDELRDPVTLSGGETFVVSLALALGLADVVTGEAGGARIETLFVDEGFGSLDSDTLELVMDTLDQLREGGRVVGVVSHVPELRTRVPAQLLVRKTRSGSTLEQGHGVG